MYSDINLSLQWSCEWGYLISVQQLIQMGANLHAKDNYCLYIASAKGHFEIVKYLILQGASINAKNSRALSEACKQNHFHIVQYLIENGSSIPSDALLYAT
jgi:ankyrin repeat protein